MGEGRFPAEPLTPAEADRLFAAVLAPFPTIIAAVSGGPDSMALLHLLAKWCRNRSGVTLLCATVDHKLRAESASEAQFVGDVARRLGVPHTIMRWDGAKPAHGLAAAARAARYGLLAAFARDVAARGACAAGPVAVVTAHTQDDQAETFLMRLKRGAGLDGLAEMARQRPLVLGAEIPDEAVLVRPFLEVPRARLRATVEAHGGVFVDDPTNHNLDYERPRVRRTLAVLESEGLATRDIARSARRLRAAHDALAYADRAFAADVGLTIDREIVGECSRAAFDRGPRALRERLISTLVRRFGGATPAPRLLEVEALCARLEGPEPVRATLGGAYISRGPQTLRVWREVGRIQPAACALSAGAEQVWDGRFWLRISGGVPHATYKVRPLGLDGLSALPAGVREALHAPARAGAALPAVYLDERLIAVPALAYHQEAGVNVEARTAWSHDV